MPKSKKPFKKAYLEITSQCNLDCSFCPKTSRPPQFITGEQFDYLLGQVQPLTNFVYLHLMGEPLLHPQLDRLLELCAQRGLKVSLTTNGTLLTDEIVKYLNDNRVMLVLSLDGSKKTHDNMRPYPGHVGSYDAAVKGFRKVIESRHGKNYYLRGTYTHYNTHFCDDVLAMLDVGSEISMEPVVGTTEPWVLTEEDWPTLDKEYEKLARAYLAKKRAGEAFDFFHFNVALDNGPCVAKRLAGCGAGHEYFAITPEGDIYPCHQFVGREKYKMGTLDTGIVKKDMVQYFRHMHVMKKEDCRTCWARFFCSGGCHANADLANSTIEKPYAYGCRIQKKRLEMAIIVQALLTEDLKEGGEDHRPVIDNFKFQVEKK